MKIRKAKESDLDQLCELGYKLLMHHSRYRKYYLPVSDDKKRIRLQKKYYKSEMKSRNTFFLVIDDGGRLAGYSIAKIEKDPPVLENRIKGNFAEIFIDKKYQGRGWGTKLLEKSLEWFRKRKVGRAIVAYDAKNQGAEDFYKKTDFKPFQNQYEIYLK